MKKNLLYFIIIVAGAAYLYMGYGTHISNLISKMLGF